MQIGSLRYSVSSAKYHIAATKTLYAMNEVFAVEVVYVVIHSSVLFIVAQDCYFDFSCTSSSFSS